MFKSKSPSTSGGVPILPGLLFCLLASCGALLFVTHYKHRAQSTQAGPTQLEGVQELKVSRTLPASDGHYLSFVMAEEKRLQKRYRDHKRKYVEPAPSEREHLDFLADREVRLLVDLEEIGDQKGLASSIQEKLENTRSSAH